MCVCVCVKFTIQSLMIEKEGGSYPWDAETSFHPISVLTFKDVASPCSVMFTHKPAKVYSLLKEPVEIVALS